MSKETVIGIIIGALLSLVASVIANLLDLKISRFVESTKFRISDTRKKNELLQFFRVTNFKKGGRDIYLFGILHAVIAVVTVGLAMSNLLAITMFALVNETGAGVLELTEVKEHVLVGVVGFFALIFLFMGMRSIKQIERTFKQFNEYDDYRAEIVKKWPEAESLESNSDTFPG